ncbi:MFS transporter [Oceanobacillus sp. HCA-5259]|uniref:MFS transporter n=1 Tax=Oceanobacillus sp. HCA-5259 TaxID=3134661 RepID=UPI0030C26572
MKIKMGELWKHADFMKFWTGETLAMFGSTIAAFVFPLVAAITLSATPMQMGLLNAAQFAPFLLVTLFAGVWIDRVRRKPLMIIANLLRAFLYLSIPLSYYFGILQIEGLYIIAFFIGTLTVLFDVSYQSFLPSLVTRDSLVEANSKLEMSRSVAQISGPGIGGGLVSLIAAPFAMLIHSITLFISALLLIFIRSKETAPIKHQKVTPIFTDIKKGLQFVLSNKYIRAISGEAATYNFFNQITWAVVILYITRELEIGPTLLGVIMATSSIGAIIGSLIANYLAQRFKIGRTILWTMFIACSSPLLIPIATGPIYISAPILIISFFFGGMGVVISNIHVISMRQTVTPDRMLGKMNASYRFLVTGVAPLGALLGGALGTIIGLRLTLVVGGLGSIAAVLWVLFSPVPSVETLNEEELKNKESLIGGKTTF